MATNVTVRITVSEEVSKSNQSSNSSSSSAAPKTPAVPAPKSTFELAFINFYPRVLMNFIPGPDADEMKSITESRQFIRTMLAKHPEHEKEFLELAFITKEKQQSLIRNLSRNTFALVAIKANEIMQMAKVEIEQLGYKHDPMVDCFELQQRISDEDLFTVNKKIEATYGMILVRADH